MQEKGEMWCENRLVERPAGGQELRGPQKTLTLRKHFGQLESFKINSKTLSY